LNHKIIFFLLLFTVARISQGQHKVYPQALYWIRYQAQFNVSTSLYWLNEADNRRFLNIDVENQMIFHSRLHYKKGAWDFGGGLTLSYIFTQRPELGWTHATTEIRPVAEMSHEFNRRKILFQNRVRIDNRFFEVNETQSIWEESRYVMRLRYRFQVRIPLKMKEGKAISFLKLAEEIMANHTGNFFDQNRLYASVDFYLTKNFSFEPGYIFIYQQRFNTIEFYARHVFRFSLIHKINPKE
jgi:hypothetical protein